MINTEGQLSCVSSCWPCVCRGCSTAPADAGTGVGSQLWRRLTASVRAQEGTVFYLVAALGLGEDEPHSILAHAMPYIHRVGHSAAIDWADGGSLESNCSLSSNCRSWLVKVGECEKLDELV